MGEDDRLLQEVLLAQRNGRWKLLVGCQLLNLTSRKQVDGVWPRFFEMWPNPLAMSAASPRAVAEELRPLGLQVRRSNLIRDFSAHWNRVPMRDRDAVVEAMAFSGVGEYGRDSWQCFVQGPTPENVARLCHGVTWPGDKELRAWIAPVRRSNDVTSAWRWQLEHPGERAPEMPVVA